MYAILAKQDYEMSCARKLILKNKVKDKLFQFLFLHLRTWQLSSNNALTVFRCDHLSLSKRDHLPDK